MQHALSVPRTDSHLPFDIAAASHRSAAEGASDSYFVGRFKSSLTVSDASRDLALPGSVFGSTEAVLMIISDGVGHTHLRSLASRIAVEVAAGATLDEMEHKTNQRQALNETIPGVRKQLIHALEASDTAIRQKLDEEHPGESGPVGSSLTLGYLVWPLLYTAHVGDTGAFVLRDGRVIPLTTEHLMSPEDSENAPHWHRAVWNLLGDSESTAAPELSKFKLEKYDRLVVCSSGIQRLLSDSELTEILNSSLSSRAAAQELVRAAARKNRELATAAIVGSVYSTP